jgi:hypothetical protein
VVLVVVPGLRLPEFTWVCRNSKVFWASAIALAKDL